MSLTRKIVGLAGLLTALWLVPDAQCFHGRHFYFYHQPHGMYAPQGVAMQAQGVFPWQQLIPPLLNLGQQFLASGNFNLPNLPLPTASNTKIVTPAVRSSVDDTTTQLKKLQDRLDTDLPPLSGAGSVTPPKKSIATPPG